MPESEGLTVLLVEDDPIDTALFKALLGHTAAFRQLHADSLRAATDVLEREEVDLVVLDLGLPDSGPEMTFDRLRASAPDLPVIVLTGHDDDEGAYRALAAGAQDYLVKPEVTETLLAKSIRYAVERHGALHLTGDLTNQYPSAGPTGAEPLPTDARDRLVDALGTLLTTRPFDGISLDDVAVAADLPIASVRSAVGSVREPLAVLLQRELTFQRSALEGALARQGGTQGVLLALIELWRAGRVFIAASMATAGDETVQGLRYRHLRELADTCLRALGDLPDTRVAQLACAELFAVLDQKLLLGELFPVDQSRDEAIDELTRRFADRLGAPPRPAAAGADVVVVTEGPVGEAAADDGSTETASADTGPGDADDEPAAKRLTGADYTAWADRMRDRRRGEIEALAPEETGPVGLDEKWSPDHLYDRGS